MWVFWPIVGEFLYKVIDTKGSTVTGFIEASSSNVARKQLQKNYRHIVELGPRREVREATHRVSTQALFIYTQQLAAMLNAGIPITRATEVLIGGDNRKMNLVMEQVLRSLIAGRSLSSAMSDYPLVFPKIYTSLVASAEASGQMNAVLNKLSDLLARQAELRKRLLATFTYPLALAVLATGVCALIVFYIFPIMQPMFSQVGMTLPPITARMIWIANALKRPGTWVSVILMLSGLTYAVRRILNSGDDQPGGWRYRIDVLVRHTPLIGSLLAQAEAARVLYAWALMLESGMRLPEIMHVLDQLLDSAYIRCQMRKARGSVTEGAMLVEALDEHKVFNRSALSMLRAGEESGRLDELMRLVARTYEQDLDLTLDRLSATLEPMVIGVMGVVVGFVCIASLLPVLKFVQQI